MSNWKSKFNRVTREQARERQLEAMFREWKDRCKRQGIPGKVTTFEKFMEELKRADREDARAQAQKENPLPEMKLEEPSEEKNLP